MANVTIEIITGMAADYAHSDQNWRLELFGEYVPRRWVLINNAVSRFYVNKLHQIYNSRTDNLFTSENLDFQLHALLDEADKVNPSQSNTKERFVYLSFIAAYMRLQWARYQSIQKSANQPINEKYGIYTSLIANLFELRARKTAADNNNELLLKLYREEKPSLFAKFVDKYILLGLPSAAYYFIKENGSLQQRPGSKMLTKDKIMFFLLIISLGTIPIAAGIVMSVIFSVACLLALPFKRLIDKKYPAVWEKEKIQANQQRIAELTKKVNTLEEKIERVTVDNSPVIFKRRLANMVTALTICHHEDKKRVAQNPELKQTTLGDLPVELLSTIVKQAFPPDISVRYDEAIEATVDRSIAKVNALKTYRPQNSKS